MKSSTTSKRLKEIIDRDGLKQVDILKKAQPYCEQYGIKLTKTDLSQYVSGKVEPGQEKLFILSQALGVDAAWLMGFEVHKYDKTAAVRRLMTYYLLLNAKGKEEAEKRVHELTQISTYTEEPIVNEVTTFSSKHSNTDSSTLVAAHNEHADEPDQQEKMRKDISKLKRPD